MSHIPVTDTIAHALMQLVDDSNNNGVYREPSHADIEFHVNQAGLAEIVGTVSVYLLSKLCRREHRIPQS